MTHTQHKKQLRYLLWGSAVVAILTLISALLAGCMGAGTSITPTPTRTPVPLEPQAALDTAVPSFTPTPAATATPTPHPDNVNPLTGEVVSNPALLDRVPVAIKIDNYPPSEVWPQMGINSADILFEHYNEGWFSSRFTAVYLGQDPERVGTVRSGRIIDLEIPAMYSAVFGCSGFSNGVLELVRNSDLYPDRIASESLPQTLSPSPFFRDETREAPFNMYTSPQLMREWANAQGISGRQDLRGMTFSNEPPTNGTPASCISVPWHLLDAEWRYDPNTGQYLRWSDGQPHMDALDNSQLSVSNLVILYVAQWETDIVEDPHWGSLSIRWALWNVDNPYRPAILFRDGMRYDGTWQRAERDDLITITDAEGNQIPFAVGNTLFEVLPAGEEHGVEIVVEP